MKRLAPNSLQPFIPSSLQKVFANHQKIMMAVLARHSSRSKGYIYHDQLHDPFLKDRAISGQ